MIETPLLPCTRCRHLKSPEAYYVAALNVRRHRTHSWCKQCFKEHRAQDYLVRPEFYKARTRKTKRKVRLKAYGLTEDSFAEMRAAQGDVCAICSQPERVQPTLVIDHDHSNGQTRGLLCSMCNPALGMFKDDPALLRAAAAYLEQFNQ